MNQANLLSICKDEYKNFALIEFNPTLVRLKSNIVEILKEL
jgi:hypothetical protein